VCCELRGASLMSAKVAAHKNFLPFSAGELSHRLHGLAMGAGAFTILVELNAAAPMRHRPVTATCARRTFFTS
jgi:hypothetical protein